MSKIEVDDEEFGILSYMFTDYAEYALNYKQDRDFICDKRHKMEDRKQRLKWMFGDAVILEKLQKLIGNAEITNIDDEDIAPFACNDMDNVWNVAPLWSVQHTAKEAGLEGYFSELMEEYKDEQDKQG